jgi:hypothetical protein
MLAVYSTSGNGADDSNAIYVVAALVLVILVPLATMAWLRLRDRRRGTPDHAAQRDTSRRSVFAPLPFSRDLAGIEDRQRTGLRTFAWILVALIAGYLASQLF